MTKQLNRITGVVIGAAIAVHRELCPGLLESAYEACLAYELAEQGLTSGATKASARKISRRKGRLWVSHRSGGRGKGNNRT